MTAFAESIGERLERAPGSAEYRRATEDLPVIQVQLASDGDAVVIEVGPAIARSGSERRGWSLMLSGPAEGWADVLAGRHPLVRETNIVHGRLVVQGDAVLAAWFMPALAVLLGGAAREANG